MIYADLNDLIREQWLRSRNSGALVWKTKDGTEIPLKDMTDKHLANAIIRLTKDKEVRDIAAEYDAYINSLDFD